MQLSQCMIVKNEEHNIRRALSWGQSIVSEQIVVDTGSTDQTVAIAQEMGARVFHFSWINDFAAAKNFAIEQAGGDWIAFLDADEYFDEESARRLPRLLKQIEQDEANGTLQKINIIRSTMHHLDSDGKIYHSHKQDRIFRNTPSTRYQGKIHETLCDLTGNPLVMLDFSSLLTIFHTGYMMEELTRKNKGWRNIELLENEQKAAPDSAQIQLYLAESYNLMYDYKEMVFRYACAATKNTDHSLPHERLRKAHFLMLYSYPHIAPEAPDALQQITAMYLNAIKIDSRWPDFDIAMGFWYYRHHNWQLTKKHLILALKKAALIPDNDGSQIIQYLPEIWYMLTVCCHYLNDWQGAVQYGTNALKCNKFQGEILISLLNQFIRVEQDSPAQVIAFLKNIYDFNNKEDICFIKEQCQKAELSLNDYLPVT